MAANTLAQMMLDAGVSPDTPAQTATGAAVNPDILAQMIADTKAAQLLPEKPPKAPLSLMDPINAFAAGANRGAVRLAGLPVDTTANVLDMGKAALGSTYGVATGKVPPDWLQITPREKVLGSGDWIQTQLDKNKVTAAPFVVPPGYENGYLQAAGGASLGVMNPSSWGNVASQIARNIAGASAGKAAYDATGSEPLAIAANIAAPATPITKTVISAPVTAKSQVLADAQAKGFVVPPSAAGNTSWTNSLLETLAGKAPLKQDATYRNAQTRATVAGESVGIPAGTPVTADALATLRAQRGAQGYAPINALGDVPTNIDPTGTNPSTFQLALAKINQNRGMSQSLDPTLRNDDVATATNAYSVPKLTGEQINTAIQQQRTTGNRQANIKYGGDVNQVPLGEARIDISKALEDLVNEHLMNQGPSNVVPNLLQARKAIAQNYTVDNALTDPHSGEVNAAPFVKRYRNELPLEGDQLLLGKFGSMFPEYNRPGVTTPAPLTSTGNVAAILGAMGAGYMGGGLYGAAAGAVPALRVPVRHMLLSKKYQDSFANPSGSNAYGFGQVSPEQVGALAQSLNANGILDQGQK